MLIRILSAAVAIIFFSAIYFFGGTSGLYGVGTLIAFGAAYEYQRLCLQSIKAPPLLRLASFFGAALIYLTLVWNEPIALYIMSAISIIYIALNLSLIKSESDLPRALAFTSAGITGFFYCGVFPAFVIKTLEFPQNGIWFFTLLAIVFAGDSCAYFVGRYFGKTALLSPVSPKKTIEGAVGGLAGSAVAALILGLLFLDSLSSSLGTLTFVALIVGAFAQFGDLFESLLKRLAGVKDSGHIMPGHGGILDRLDGVLFAAPIFYVLVRFLLLS
jgi:phosphatidate cytidylyltransferase